MEEFQNYLPFFFIAAVYIFSAVYNSKKNKNTDASKTTLPKGIPTFSTSSNPSQLPTTKMIREKIVQENRFMREHNPEVKSSVSVSEQHFNEIEEEMNIPFHLDMKDENELKKAIIYSEILNRKY